MKASELANFRAILEADRTRNVEKPGQASTDLLAALVGSLGRDEALGLLRMLWARFRDRFPAWGRWIVDRLLASGPQKPEPSKLDPGATW